MKRLLSTAMILAAALAALMTALPAAAQFAKPEDAIKYRQSVMTVIAAHFGRIGAVVQGKAPYDAKTTADNAAIVYSLSKLPFTAFVEGSDKGGNTKAKPEIWKEGDKFQASAKDFQDQAAKLDTAAKSGNLDAVKAAFGDTGKACKACHDNFREK
jgi:cytochrome c556